MTSSQPSGGWISELMMTHVAGTPQISTVAMASMRPLLHARPLAVHWGAPSRICQCENMWGWKTLFREGWGCAVRGAILLCQLSKEALCKQADDFVASIKNRQRGSLWGVVRAVYLWWVWRFFPGESTFVYQEQWDFLVGSGLGGEVFLSLG
jgi:hypothetical protein